MTALFVLDARLRRAAGPQRNRQLLAELHALDAELQARGGRLRVHAGDPVDVVPRVARELGAARAHWNADVTPWSAARDAAVRGALAVDAATPYGHLVLPPGAVTTGAGRVHRVFGAFHRAWLATPWDPWPEPGDAEVAADVGEPLPRLDAEPVDAAGETAAHARLERLVGVVDEYAHLHEDLAAPGASELSVALHFGTISPREVVQGVRDAGPSAGGEAFVRQLAWRDWFAHLLAEEPSLTEHALRPELDAIAWRDDPEGFEAWTRGRTGYPLVDAGMRELAATGRLHNRVRMVAASFLVKDLLIDWRVGERHFRRLLLDGDVAQNVGNWQWVAGTGPDAAPYFRVFNPVTQSRTHDPDGSYLRRWLPELAGLDDRAIHAPWELGPLELAAAGVTLGDTPDATYPAPILDHAMARGRALAAHRIATSAHRA